MLQDCALRLRWRAASCCEASCHREPVPVHQLPGRVSCRALDEGCVDLARRVQDGPGSMKPNIFTTLYSSRSTREDVLTAFWCYVLNVVPGLGQNFVDEICRQTALPNTRFVGAIDHPMGDEDNHPDLLLQCDAWNLMFEHKVGSPLGPRQMHRYLAVASERGCQLALMASERIELEQDVLSSETYVRPLTPGAPAHFLWQDLHPLLIGSGNHLGHELSDFLEEEGLGRVSWNGRGNPMIDLEARATFVGIYEALKPVFQGPTVRFSKSANSLVYQVRTPFKPIHLINLAPVSSVAEVIPALRGPVVDLWVWVRRASPTAPRVLAPGQRTIADSTLPITVHNRARPGVLRDDSAVFCERSYYIPLDSILLDNLDHSRAALVEFVRACVSDLRGELS
jgi:hypothetical protein